MSSKPSETPKEPNSQKVAPPKPPGAAFVQSLRQIRKGAMLAELDESLADAVARAIESGKPASMKITLKIKPEEDMVEIDDDIVVTLPKSKKGKSRFYASPDGALSKTDPKQMELGLEVLEPEIVDFTK